MSLTSTEKRKLKKDLKRINMEVKYFYKKPSTRIVYLLVDDKEMLATFIPIMIIVIILWMVYI